MCTVCGSWSLSSYIALLRWWVLAGCWRSCVVWICQRLCIYLSMAACYDFSLRIWLFRSASCWQRWLLWIIPCVPTVVNYKVWVLIHLVAGIVSKRALGMSLPKWCSLLRPSLLSWCVALLSPYNTYKFQSFSLFVS